MSWDKIWFPFNFLKPLTLIQSISDWSTIKFTSENNKFNLFSILLIVFFKLVVLASKSTTFPFLNPDGENDGAFSLIEATKKLLGNEIERTSMRKAARSEAERWGWEGATKQLRSYYEDVLDKKQSNIAA